MSMVHVHRRMSGLRLVLVLAGAGLILTGLAILFSGGSTSRQRAGSRFCRKSTNQLVTAQENYAQGRQARGGSSRWFTGIESQPGDKNLAELQTSDASRVYVFLLRRGLLDQASSLACPSDPFVSILDARSDRMPSDDDLPVEGKALGASLWASPNSVTATESGRTWFSYSMHTASANRLADFGPRGPYPKIPVFSDRNPECDVFGKLGAGDSGPIGNSWNHDREGQSVAFSDGHNAFLADAGMLELPLDPARPHPSATGFDHLFNDEPVAQGESRSGRKCIPPGTFGQTKSFGAWLTD